MRVNKWIWVTFDVEGIHCYPEALNNPELSEVSFLGYPHRHKFSFRVEITVTHDNRDIEFILFQRELKSLYSTQVLQLDYKSCEMIATDLHKYISEKYPGRDVVIEVSEDNENGCRIQFET